MSILFGSNTYFAGAFGAPKIFADFSGYLRTSAVIYRVLLGVAIFTTISRAKYMRNLLDFTEYLDLKA